MCDLEPTVMDDSFRNSSLKNLFAPEKLINCSEDAVRFLFCFFLSYLVYFFLFSQSKGLKQTFSMTKLKTNCFFITQWREPAGKCLFTGKTESVCFLKRTVWRTLNF